MSKNNWDIANVSGSDKQLIKAYIKQVQEPLQEIADAKAEIQDVYIGLKEKTGIPKNIWNVLIQAEFKQNKEEVQEKTNSISEALDMFNE